jgi:hypothetical protein
MMGQRRSIYLVAVTAMLGTSPAPSTAQTITRPPAILPTLDKPCRLGGEEIVVCGRREKERSPYRLPEPPPRFDAGEGTASASRERNSLLEHGDTGIHSCSTVGPAGYTGCTFKAWKQSDEQWGGKARAKRKRPGEFGEK